MTQRNLKGTVGTSLAPDLGTTALNLVYQAAEVFSSMEDHAREAEARAYSICKSAAEGLDLAEKRIEAVESARRETDCELLETSRALKQAQSRIEAAEDKLAALEFSAQATEIRCRRRAYPFKGSLSERSFQFRVAPSPRRDFHSF